MYSKAMLALAPVAAQAAQSASWPVFNLRANVTQQYPGYGPEDWDRRVEWHNAPLMEVGYGGDDEVTGPLFDDSQCSTTLRPGVNEHGPNFRPYFFFANSTSTGMYAPTELISTESYKLLIAQKTQADANGRRPVAMADCGTGSTSIYISAEAPYHLTYDNQDADEEFGSFYLCGSTGKGDGFSYGDALFYRSADENTPEECGEVIYYPECMVLNYSGTNTQGDFNGTVYTGENQAGHYNATCYVDVADVDGAPNTDITDWWSIGRGQIYDVGKIDVPSSGPASY